MNKSAIIIHGKPSREGYFNPDSPSQSNSVWIPWLQKELLLDDIPTQTPEMLRSYQPDYSIWSKTMSDLTVDEDTILIGHSCGGGFIIQWLSENSDIKTDNVYLVAPAFGDSLVSDPADKYEDELLNGFFDFTPDINLLNRIKDLTIIYSDNDSIRVNNTIDLLKKYYPQANYRLFSNYGHFTSEPAIKNGKFPELLDIIRSSQI